MTDYARLLLSTIDKPGYWFLSFWTALFIAILVGQKILLNKKHIIRSSAAATWLLSIFYVIAAYIYHGIRSIESYLIYAFFYHPSIAIGLLLTPAVVWRLQGLLNGLAAFLVLFALILSVCFHIPKIS